MQEYNRDEERLRFLQEVARLKAKRAFTRDADFCAAIGKPANYLGDLQHPLRSQILPITTQMLYYAHAIYNMDIIYVITGVSRQPKPATLELSKLRKSGRMGPRTRKKRKPEEE